MRKRKYLLPVCSFFAGSAILLFAYALIGVFPFGNKALLVIDLSYQYVDFFSFLRHSFFSDPNNLLYSLSTALGGDTFGLTAYYLLSPLNILILIFPESHLLEAVLAISVIKSGLCCTFFTVFLEEEKLQISRFLILGFSLMYGLCAYSVVYAMCPMWIDGVVLLPLVITGAVRIARGKSPVLYCVSLIVTIITNYYIGFMVCLFTVLYFIALSISESKKAGEFQRKLVRFGVYSLLSGLCCAALLLPVILTLKDSRMGYYQTDYSLYFDFSPLDFLTKLFTGYLDTVKTTDNQYGLPNVFAGVLSVVGLPLYFLNGKISRKERTCFGTLIAVLFLSMLLNPVNLLWHGMQEPYWYPYRFSFVFSFTLVTVSLKGLMHAYELPKGRLFAAAVTGTAPFVLGSFFAPYLFVLTTALFLSIYLSFLYKRLRPVFLCAAIFAEMTLSTVFYIKKIDSTYHYETRESYTGYIKNLKELLANIKDDSLYRTEKTVTRSRNDNMSLFVNGIAHYSSSFNNNVNDFAKGVGFLQPRFYTIYKGATPLTDSLLGIKYIVSDVECPYYQKIAAQGELTLYQNPYTLPLAFLSESDCADYGATADPIGNQLRLLNKINGYDTGAFVKQTAERHLDTFTVTADGDGPLYFYFKSPYHVQCDLYINGVPSGNYFRDYIYPENHYNIVYAGEYKKGEILTVSLIPPKGFNTSITGAYFYRLDMDALTAALQSIPKATVEKLSATHYKITAESDRTTTIFTTIPYQDGFRVKINGQKADAKTSAGAFFSFPAGKGKTVVEIEYSPKGMTAGFAISCVFLLILILVIKKDSNTNLNKKDK